ncbi:UbiH/UbiF/VisC/COQ6 family ubiquinone biosynthesis hydroxylase [Sulfuriflexus sp.]|uniref:UbiH/UbiF/VisC/COQ6 family ubiquinone biosynthesis hydroxylase n=1 Tax=Sulfuriflexus sp. TaxID=2015443 RepID=UPI0028CFCE7B|nr:UbiH/UbiF/VisC/COQ6 family ubiquinone biosynthesis hydroxylase [Sulfuriflexus sp.]MDT8405576.1 UbiH/UbiF/VisC/COQ6 family ubiquinone biosynthesis hydroxylase [Sulfuriflexus sp.]
MAKRDYDILIVGAGMVGAALACALGQARLRVALIEAQPFEHDWPPESFDQRVSAIMRASQNIFTALGAWEDMCAQRVSPYRDMHVWDASGNGVIHFDSADIGEPVLGHIIENRVIQSALLKRVAALDSVELIAPASVAGFDTQAEHVRVTLDNGRNIDAAMIVGADGGGSPLRQQAGIEVQGWSYEQEAVVARIETSASHQETAWQRFMPDGPLAFLPLADGSSSIVWSTTPAHARELLAMDDSAFLDALQISFGDALGRMLSCGPRASFPLRMQHAKQYTQPRLALVGDAAHTIHPLAGQGVNLGLADAAALAEVVVRANRQHEDIGEHRVLRRYERWRKGDNQIMIASMEAFKRLFGSKMLAVRWLRNTGLRLTDRLPPAKNLIMRQAMGMEGELSQLARGKDLT